MRRFRVLFFLVASALLVPMALLVRRALESVDLEKRVRHETVAERLFDEMERALSDFLTREEERTFGQYGYRYTPPGQPPGVLAPSPLSEIPSLSFIVGYFQIDPDGSLHTPLRPRDGPDWKPAPQISAAITEIERTVGATWREGASGGPARAVASTQAPGSTVELQESDDGVRAAQEAMRNEREVAGPVSAYDALRALNKGVEQRAERQGKVSQEPPRSEDVAARGPANEAVSFELSPMMGRLIAPGRLLLYRTVIHEQRGYRQGLLLDVAKLGDWLRDQALGSTGLAAYATVAFAAESVPPTASGGIYQHRFAEPFEDLSARLVLTALPDGGSATYVYAFSALLFFATLLGLAAIYRMVAVVLRYAEQRGNFVAAVTHELRTPLTAIRMYGEMLRDGMVASESKRDEYHRHITAESERLTRLVNNVLELSRLEKGTRPASLGGGFLGPVVHEVAALVRPHVEGEGLRLRVELDPDLPAVRFERDALIQVLFNLVDNAVKYANGAAEKEILLRGRRDGDELSLSVRDHGPGVPARHLRKIFEPFYRAESELTRRSKGTGLGLALARALVEQMGARITGRNVPEGGFEVEIVFRAASTAA